LGSDSSRYRPGSQLILGRAVGSTPHDGATTICRCSASRA